MTEPESVLVFYVDIAYMYMKRMKCQDCAKKKNNNKKTTKKSRIGYTIYLFLRATIIIQDMQKCKLFQFVSNVSYIYISLPVVHA